ncbi:hypothetical protein BS47DRAFT_1402061 [Hydnum rufescens UP504]|uniref:Uncharacterized protein n=1 Tax=Hydnum rufescens UP504 TaxID=1448309 RepID=A0A9P6ADJ4_9AGAM|nr:hypothetical protein BS47DRAFT_1402061 [Hydnum rufescens UP504]
MNTRRTLLRQGQLVFPLLLSPLPQHLPHRPQAVLVLTPQSNKKTQSLQIPTAEVVGAGPSGVIMTESSRIGGYPSGPVVWSTFVESRPLDIDLEPSLCLRFIYISRPG